MTTVAEALAAAPEDADLAHKYAALHSGARFMAGQFGTATRAQFGRAFGSEGAHILDGMVSQGWARYRPQHDDYALTEAGHKADRSQP
jgi:hypothetical protein